VKRFSYATTVPVAPEEVWAWHCRPGALERAIPPWERARVIERAGVPRAGDRVVLDVRRGPVRRRWVATYGDVHEGRSFKDVQTSGPFAHWEHEHVFVPEGDGCRVEDHVEYALPWYARPAGGYARGSLARMFAFRHRRLADDLRRHDTVRGPALRIAVAGATGMIGSELVAFLRAGGHDVLRLVRGRATEPNDIVWNPASGVIDASRLEGLHAVVNLTGRRIDTRWTARRKAEIRDSRVGVTALLAETLARLEQAPQVLVSASAIGIYGARRDDELTEQSTPGAGFLAELCRDWEAAAEPARAAGIRVVTIRTAPVLSPRGTPLSKLLLPTRLGLGAVVGRGDQALSWVGLDDLVGAVLHLLRDDRLDGPVNVASPRPVTLRELADTLASVLGRRRFLRVPAAPVQAITGDMGDETIFASQRVMPKRLVDTGFEFFYPDLRALLAHELGRSLDE
jgi:hypothetical protein